MATKTKCQAKNPETCFYHGTATAAAPTTKSLYEAYEESRKAAPVPVKVPKNAVNSAVESSLVWKGKQPSWWKQYEAEALKNEGLPVKAELIDVVDSPLGKLAVVWQDGSMEKRDRGLSEDSGMGTRVCYYKSFETGETLGYVKMTYIDDASAEKSFGNDEFTPFRWEDRYSGTSYGFRFQDDMEATMNGNLTEEELLKVRKKVWSSAQRSSGKGITNSEGKYIPSYNISEEDIPEGEALIKDLKAFSKEMNKTIKAKKKYFATPFVDYSKVDKSLKGKGFGAALYVYTARKLGENGQVLRGSGVQSDDAQSLWGKFKEKFPDNVSTIKLTNLGRQTTAPTLDFRKKVS